jgi:hypothetical protein
MHPLVSIEIRDVDLLRVLNRGLVPAHYLDSEYERSLRAYVVDYLKQEVFDEGLARNVAAFSRFFEAVGYSHATSRTTPTSPGTAASTRRPSRSTTRRWR